MTNRCDGIDLEHEEPTPSKGDSVRILIGTFAGLTGRVLDADDGYVRISVIEAPQQTELVLYAAECEVTQAGGQL